MSHIAARRLMTLIPRGTFASSAVSSSAVAAMPRASLASAAAAGSSPRAARRPRHLLTCSSLTAAETEDILRGAVELKANPERYDTLLKNKTLLMFFAKPSLRTRISFEVGMTQLGGHAIYYDLRGQNLGVKESFSDHSKVCARYGDIVMARVMSRSEIDGLAGPSDVPLLNALDDWGHPCQLLADWLTLHEQGKVRLDGTGARFTGHAGGRLRFCFLGDTRNNVTYDIIRSTLILGGDVVVAGPDHPDYKPHEELLAEAAELSAASGGTLRVLHDPEEAAKGADVLYADSFMSYHIDKAEQEKRLAILAPYMITQKLMRLAAPSAVFMHCLPALRNVDVAPDVIDGPQSVVFDEAENRLHAQKSIMLFFLNKLGPVLANAAPEPRRR